MDTDDFENLIFYSQATVNSENKTIDFIAYKGFEKIIAELIKKYNLEDLPLNKFNELANKHMPIIQAKRKIRETKINKFLSMSFEEISKLSLEEKIDYIENIFHKYQTNKQLKDICSENKQKLTTLLYHIKLPKDFWLTEEKSADRFVSLVANDTQIVNNMKNWQNLSLDDKKSTLKATAKIIEYIYDTPLEINFYTSAEYRKEHNLDDNAHVFGAYHSQGKIFFNTDRLENVDNYTAISTIFHEFMHKRQHETDFNDPLINRLFASKIYNATGYEMQHIDQNSPEYGDLYSLMPGEIHAFSMQKYIENKLAEKTGIEKTQSIVSQSVQQVHNKSFATAATSRYHSNQK